MEQVIEDFENIKQFVLAGNATFTIYSKKSGSHLTFKVKKLNEKSPYFVSVLNGPDNYENYQYLGCIFQDRDSFVYKHGKKSHIGADAVSNKAFSWFFNGIIHGKDFSESAEFYHEGKCARCGRKLTTPESITEGIGPICKGKMVEYV